jgi:hypothetical protein
MAPDPLVPAANPIPIAVDPYIARRGCDTDDLDPRRRRRDHDHATNIVTLIGDDHTSRQ